MDHPKDLAHVLLRKLCCWVKPTGKSAGVCTSIKKQDNVNCFIICLDAALGRERKQGEVGVMREGEALKLPGLGTQALWGSNS